MTLAPTSRPATLAPADLTRDFLAGLSASTRATYSKGFRAFARWLPAPSPEEACAAFLSLAPGDANRVASSWRGAMLDAGLSPATAEVRVSALRSLVKAGMLAGTHSAPLTIPPLRSAKVRKLRNTAGPGDEVVSRLFEVADLEETAILRLLADRGLRVGEVGSLRVGDFEPAACVVFVAPKGGGGQRERVTLSAGTCAAVAAWRSSVASADDEADDPLFPRARTAAAVAYRVRRLAARAGVPPFRPHGLRHHAVTRAIRAAGGDIRAAQMFSRHADPRVLLRYDDDAKDRGGELARKVAGE